MKIKTRVYHLKEFKINGKPAHGYPSGQTQLGIYRYEIIGACDCEERDGLVYVGQEARDESEK